MYMDSHATYVLATDAAAATTKALPRGQRDLIPVENRTSTADLSNDDHEFVVIQAGANAVAAMTVDMQTSDTQTGTFTTLMTINVPDLAPGQQIAVQYPRGVKNWIRYNMSAATALTIFDTVNPPKQEVSRYRA